MLSWWNTRREASFCLHDLGSESLTVVNKGSGRSSMLCYTFVDHFLPLMVVGRFCNLDLETSFLFPSVHLNHVRGPKHF